METVQYAILQHTGVAEPHYDVLIETVAGTGALRAWRSPAWPITEPVPLQALPNHRRDYLTYEGAVSGGRGLVKRVACGTCKVARLSEKQLIVDLDGGERFNFIVTRGEQWLAMPMPRRRSTWH